MASPASPPAYQDYPIYTSITNIHGMINVLKLARQHNARVIQASTSEVYGDPAVHPQVESYWGNVNPVGIRSCYDEAKRMAETLCADHMRQFGIDVRIARFFNTYGPNMDPNDGRVVSNFICQALRGEDLTIYGDGSQTRSFCYVDDTIEAFNKLGLVDLSHITDPQKRIVNIGNPGEFTIKELAELVLETMKEQRIETKSEIVYKDLPEDDPKQRQPNISYAKEILGWGGPKTELREGISETIPYFQEQLALAA
jgi:UDP-glucuronate decarboxylase